MSFNRGFRRDDRSSYRSNMGQSSGQRSINVSPWECGVVPNAGMSRNAIPLQSLLPTPQTQTNPNILSQQQHALVMASNLLSNLGLLQQQPQHQQELPSLINMSTLNNMGNSGQFRLPQNYGQASNRYNNMNAMRRKPHESHRVEPYKNRPRPNQFQQLGQQQGRRPNTNKPAQDRRPGPGFRGTGDKASPVKALSDLRQKLKKPVVTLDESEAESKKLDPVDKSNLVDKTPGEEPQVKSSLIDEEAKRDDDEDDGIKREWKDEKKTDLVLVVDASASDDKPAESAVDDVKTDDVPVIDEAVEATGNKVDEVQSSSKSTEIKFSCHVCNKYMYDEQSLSNHVNSKMHKLSMVKLDESYKAQVEALRLSMQEAVNKHELEMQRQRGYRSTLNRPRDFCKMCDLHFFGSIASHRKNETHLQLKTFLHPRCVPCAKEFPTRMEWESHKLTVKHQTTQRAKEQSSVRKDSERAIVKQERGDKNAAYDPFVTHGQEYLVTGQQCRVCDMFFERRSDARTHCKTREHYDNCAKARASEEAVTDGDEAAKEGVVTNIKSEGKLADADEEAPVNDVEMSSQGPELSENIVAAKEGSEDNEGNWKRRRVAETEEDDDEGDIVISNSTPKREAEVFVIDDTPPATTKTPQLVEGSKLYDPLEEDAEMEGEGSSSAKETPAEKMDDSVLEDLDREIDSILDTVEETPAKTEGDAEGSDVETKTVASSRGGNKAKRGTRGRKRK